MEGVDPNIIVAQLGFIEALGCAIVGGVISVVIAVIENKRSKEREADLAYRKEREADEKKRQERDKAIYDVVLSTARGTELLLQQAHGEQLNGNVERALKGMRADIGKYNSLSNKNMAEL